MAEGESFFAGSDALLAGSQYPTVGHEFWNLNDPGAGEQLRNFRYGSIRCGGQN